MYEHQKLDKLQTHGLHVLLVQHVLTREGEGDEERKVEEEGKEQRERDEEEETWQCRIIGPTQQFVYLALLNASMQLTVCIPF